MTGLNLKIGLCKIKLYMAGTTGLEPATSGVTGRRSNQLNYVPKKNNQQLTAIMSICRQLTVVSYQLLW